MGNRDWNQKVLMVKPMLGIASMIVCCTKDATDEEILDFCNRNNLCGTSRGWCQVVRKDKKYPQRDPVACQDEDGRERFHIIVDC